MFPTLVDKLEPQQIRFMRKSLMWNQEQFASFIGITRAVVSNWERGESYPNKENVEKLIYMGYLISAGRLRIWQVDPWLLRAMM